MNETVVISGGYPFGFRVSGGAEHKQNIIVSRISPGSNAYTIFRNKIKHKDNNIY